MNKNTESTVNQRIKILIVSQKMKQKDFSEHLKISEKVMSNVINGKNPPNFGFIEAILRNFDRLNARWLILGEGEMWEGEVKEAAPAKEYNEVDRTLADLVADESVMTYYAVNTVTELSKQVEAYEVINDKLRTENRLLKDELKKLKP